MTNLRILLLLALLSLAACMPQNADQTGGLDGPGDPGDPDDPDDSLSPATSSTTDLTTTTTEPTTTTTEPTTTTTEPTTTTTEPTTTTTEPTTTTTEPTTTTTEPTTTTTEPTTTTTDPTTTTTTTTDSTTTTTDSSSTDSSSSTTDSSSTDSSSSTTDSSSTDSSSSTTDSSSTDSSSSTTDSTSSDPTGSPSPQPPTSEPDNEDKPSYTISGDDKKPCLLVRMKISIDVPYTTKTNEIAKVTVQVPEDDATYGGACEDGEYPILGQQLQGPVLAITWSSAATTTRADPKHTVAVQFNATGEETFIQSVLALFDNSDANYFPNADNSKPITVAVPVNDYHVTKGSGSFRCNSEKSFDNEGSSVKLESVRYESGKNISESFADGPTCSDDETDNTVAIAVGVTIAVLVVIVVAGFLYKRHRDKKR